MKFVEILQGKWLGHSLHGAIVHVPVGAWIAACALDIAVVAGWGGAALSRLALWCVGAGLVVVLAAVPTGLAEWSEIKRGKPAWKIALVHMVINLVAAALWGVNFWLRWRARDGAEPVPMAVLVTSIVATLLLMVTAYLGSLMVFDHGVSVARHSKKEWRKIAAHGGARLPEEK